MKLNFSKIADAFQDALKSKKSKRGKDFVNPQKHWFFALTIATVIFIFSAVYVGLDFYVQFANPEDEVIVDVVPLQYRDKDVILYAKIYDEREAIFNALRAERSYVPPPIEISSTTDQAIEDEKSDEGENGTETVAEEGVSE